MLSEFIDAREWTLRRLMHICIRSPECLACVHELWRVRFPTKHRIAWWRHQMETFSPLLAICAGNSPVTAEFPTQRPMTRSFDVFFDLRLNKRLGQQSWGWWFETLSRPLWSHCNGDWSCSLACSNETILKIMGLKCKHELQLDLVRSRQQF